MTAPTHDPEHEARVLAPRGQEAEGGRMTCTLTACRTCTPCAHDRHDACRGESWCPNDQEARACECCGEAL